MMWLCNMVERLLGLAAAEQQSVLFLCMCLYYIEFKSTVAAVNNSSESESQAIDLQGLKADAKHVTNLVLNVEW